MVVNKASNCMTLGKFISFSVLGSFFFVKMGVLGV